MLRQRGERLERPNAHLYETGRMRRSHLRGHPNILKRLLVQVCGVNLGLLMRHLTGVGRPRSLQGRAATRLGALVGLLRGYWGRARRFWAPERHDRPDSAWDGFGDTPIRTRDSRLRISPVLHNTAPVTTPPVSSSAGPRILHGLLGHPELAQPSRQVLIPAKRW